MKKLILFVAILMLAGCVSNPILPPEPIKLENIPAELSNSCPDLQNVDLNTTKLSDVITTVTDNYTLYHSCRAQVDELQKWYKKQQSIINKLK